MPTANPGNASTASFYDAFSDAETFGGSIGISGSVAGGGAALPFTDIYISNENTDIQPQVRTSLASNYWYILLGELVFQRTGAVFGFPSPYQVVPFAFHVAPKIVRAGAIIINPYIDPLDLQAETLDFNIKSFHAPYRYNTELGTKATGTIRLENRDYATDVTIPAYTVLTEGEKTFVTTADCLVPGFTGSSGSPTPGINFVAGIAVHTGVAYNIPSGTYLQMKGEWGLPTAPNDWRAYADGGFSGGS